MRTLRKIAILVAVAASAAAMADTGYLANNKNLSSGKSYGWPAGYEFKQQFTAQENGVPEELAVNMGNNQNPYGMRVAIDVGGQRIYDNTFAGLKQRPSDWATSFPLAGVRGAIRRGDVVTITMKPDQQVGMEPILVDNPAWPRAELRGYGKVALKFYLRAAMADVKATAPVGGAIAWPDGTTCGTACTAKLNFGSTAVLTAQPAGANKLKSWSGPCTGTAPTCGFVVAPGLAPVSAEMELVPTVVKIAGDNQKKNFVAMQPGVYAAGAAYDPLQVKVLGGDGKPIAGAQVKFECITRGGTACAMVPSYNYPSKIVATGADGIATLNGYNGSSLILYYDGGTMVVRASYLSAYTDFTVVGVGFAYKPTTIKILAGGDQTKARDKNDTRYTGGAAAIDSIQVQLVDTDGKGVPGLSVCPTGQAPYPMQCVIGTANECTTTGSDGKAAFGKGLCWDGTGDWNVKIIANVPGQAQANVTTRVKVTN